MAVKENQDINEISQGPNQNLNFFVSSPVSKEDE